MTPDTRHFRLAGLLYVAIITLGIGAELALRGPLIDLADPAATVAAIAADPARFRLGIAADIAMALADAALAVLLYLIFRPFAPALALAAMVFRLLQTAIIGGNLMNLQAAWLSIAAGHEPAQVALFLDMHAHGYDLGLVFFGINSLLTGVLIWRTGLVARVIGPAMAAAGVVYLVGSGLRFLAPGLSETFAGAYAIPVLAETAFAAALLLGGRPARAHA